jgi:hypothetical protein
MNTTRKGGPHESKEKTEISIAAWAGLIALGLRFSLMDSDNDGSNDWAIFAVDSSLGYGPSQLVLTVAP